jgi:hypothetical protein
MLELVNIKKVYAEGDNRPKCVLMPYVKPDYGYERRQVIDEVRQRVRDIAKDYDVVCDHHAACTYCEHRCQHFDRVRTYPAEKIQKMLSLLRERSFTPGSMCGFLNSDIVKKMALPDAFANRCLLGYILSFEKSINEGQRRKLLADYMAYCASKQ